MQAARGASLNPSDATHSSPRRYLALFGAIGLVAYAIDQITKVLATQHLTQYEDVQVIGDLLTLTLVYNPGAAFGAGDTFTWLFTCLAVVAAGVVLYLAPRVRDTAWAVGLGLLLAGIVGNLTDRVLRAPSAFHGHVVDFLQLPNWPVFNVADICINLAAAVIIVQAFRGIRLDGTREVAAPRTKDQTIHQDQQDSHPSSDTSGDQPKDVTP